MKQEVVLERLLAGATITEAAAAGGVSRRTVHNWLADDADFIAARNRARRDLADAADARLLALADRAVDTISGAVEGGDVRAALAILRGLGLLSGQDPRTAPSTPEEVSLDIDERASGRRAREINRLLGDL